MRYAMMMDSPMSIMSVSKSITSYKCYLSPSISHHSASISFNGCVRVARSANNITGIGLFFGHKRSDNRGYFIKTARSSK